MKNFLKHVAIIGLLTAGVACENKPSNSEPQTVAAAADPSVDPLASADATVAAQTALVPSGGMLTTSTVVAHEGDVGETPAGNEDMTWDEILAAYPALADRTNFLASIDKVVETDARTFDLYAGGALVLTLQYTQAGDALVVKSSTHTGFAADLITFESVAAEQSQGAVVDRIDFVMSSCKVKEEEQEQDQDQNGKEEPVKEEPKQECASVVAGLVLEQVVEKPEQEQKEEPKQEQDQKQK